MPSTTALTRSLALAISLFHALLLHFVKIEKKKKLQLPLFKSIVFVPSLRKRKKKIVFFFKQSTTSHRGNPTGVGPCPSDSRFADKDQLPAASIRHSRTHALSSFFWFDWDSLEDRRVGYAASTNPPTQNGPRGTLLSATNLTQLVVLLLLLKSPTSNRPHRPVPSTGEASPGAGSRQIPAVRVAAVAASCSTARDSPATWAAAGAVVGRARRS